VLASGQIVVVVVNDPDTHPGLASIERAAA
jgi:hypothetical protein